MKQSTNSRGIIAGLVVVACLVMGIVDAVIQPGYLVKSAVKLVLFLGVPVVYWLMNRQCGLGELLKPRRGTLKLVVAVGALLYALIVGGYFLTRGVLDYSSVTTGLGQGVGVTRDNFIWVALYISVVNSLLEEFFFRGFAFGGLRQVASARVAQGVSAGAFALYHIAMMIGWFGWGMIVLAVVGLVIGGLFFNVCTQRSGSIYLSWGIHMCANLGINTVGCILFGII